MYACETWAAWEYIDPLPQWVCQQLFARDGHVKILCRAKSRTER